MKKKIIVFSPEIEVQHEDKKTILGSIKVACVFLIENIEDFKKGDSEVIVLPNEIITTLNSISLSTARGVMFSQFRDIQEIQNIIENQLFFLADFFYLC